MGKLQFIEVDSKVEDIIFDCGIESINNYIRESYYPHIVQNAYTYNIMYKDIILGYYQIMFREIKLEDFPEEISDYSTEINNGKLSAVHIRFIAIDEKYQKNGIGTAVLHTIIEKVRQLSIFWPIRVITIDAKLDLIGWYSKIGFNKMINNTVGQDGTTEAMYFDCMNHMNQLKEYLDSKI